jgi:hypothetical protein
MLANTVIVLSGASTLRQAIGLKREGRIARLLAGPNIMVFPSEHPGLLADPEVDLCITPADWVCEMYERDCPALKGRCAAWPAGVDTAYWCPGPLVRQPGEVLVFDKQALGLQDSLSDYIAVLKRRNYRVSVISYGSYTPDEYLSRLRRASLMVGFSTSESQGIAWAEAWATNVPTLVWCRAQHSWSAGHTVMASTAPYLCDRTGLFFASVADFGDALTRWASSRELFDPRQWVLEHMSDQVCARQLCELAGVPVG